MLSNQKINKNFPYFPTSPHIPSNHHIPLRTPNNERDLGGAEDEKGHNGGVHVAVDDETCLV